MLFWSIMVGNSKNTANFAALKNERIAIMTFSQESFEVFERAIADYHKFDNVDTPISNPYKEKSIEFYLYLKNWIDTVQWHLEDIIRDPQIDPVEALAIKRRIDRSNQDRTDLVELIDSYFLDKFGKVQTLPNATINTEPISSSVAARNWPCLWNRRKTSLSPSICCLMTWLQDASS